MEKSAPDPIFDMLRTRMARAYDKASIDILTTLIRCGLYNLNAFGEVPRSIHENYRYPSTLLCFVNLWNPSFNRTNAYILTKALVESGADINLFNDETNSPINTSLIHERYKSFDYLLKLNPNLNAKNSKGNHIIALTMVRIHNNITKFKDRAFNCLEKLINNGCNINARNQSDHTALTYSARVGNLEEVKFLLSHGADPTLKCTVNGEILSPLDLAKNNNRLDVVEYLQSQGIKE